jgi:hypothetical protein
MSADGGASGTSTATSNEVGAAAVETSAKHRESTQRKIKDYKTQVTSYATIETPATLPAARVDCCHAMRFVF